MKIAVALIFGIVCLHLFVEQTLAMNNRLRTKGSVKTKGNKYELEFSFEHDLSLPYGTAELCSSPSNIASDGLPYLATRYFPYELSKKVTKRTGFHTVGLDWNPCGHPPADVFTKPHYDVHFYMISDEYRSGMTCDLIPNAPVCNPGAQSTDAGQKFFKYVPTGTGGHLTNMPEGYETQPDTAVPQMGTHSYHPDQPSVSQWLEPVLVMGSYDSKVIFWEPMVPAEFVSGDSENTYDSGYISYVDQTIPGLPSRYTAEYNPNNGRTTFTLHGQRYEKCPKGTTLDVWSDSCIYESKAATCSSWDCDPGYVYEDGECKYSW